MSFLAASKFRFANVKENKLKYGDIRPSEPSPTSLSIAASHNFVAALSGNGSDIVVLPSDVTKYERSSIFPVVNAHSGKVSDLAFSPYDPNHLATSSFDDSSVKLFKLPEGGLTKNVGDSECEVKFDAGINSISYHPSVPGLLLAGGKSNLAVVDLNRGESVFDFKMAGFGKDIISTSWSYDGSIASAVGKDFRLHTFDPRSAAGDILNTSSKHKLKLQRSMFIGSGGHFLVIGLDVMRNAKLQIYDIKKADTPIATVSPGFSTGTLLPLYDNDTELLWVCCRGSAMVNQFDCSNMAKPTKTGSSSGKSVIQGYNLAPKSALDTETCEVQRIYSLTKSDIEVFNVSVTRKQRGFHDELYPQTRSMVTSNDVDGWKGGKDVFPRLDHIHRIQESLNAGSSSEQKADTSSSSTTTAAAATPDAAAAAPKHTRKPVVEEKKEEPVFVSYKKSDVRKHLDSQFKKCMFANAKVAEPQAKDQSYFDIEIDACLSLGRNIRMNKKYFAVPVKSIGGSGLLVRPLSALGRVGKTGYIRGHNSQISAYDLHHFQPNLVVTGASDAYIKLYSLPSEEVLEEDYSTPVGEFRGIGKILTTDFHPYVDNVMVTSSAGFDKTTLSVWDLNTEAKARTFDCHNDYVLSVSFSYDGSLMATSSRDGVVRLLDVRASKVVHEFKPIEDKRDTQVIFAGSNDRLITTGFGSMSRRSVSLWSTADLSKPLSTVALDTSTDVPVPYFDMDTNLLVLASMGSRVVRLYNVKSDGIEYLSFANFDHELTGFAFNHKTEVDVMGVEIFKGLYASSQGKNVKKFSYTQLRKRTEFFQDDVYPPTLSAAPLMDSTDYFDGKTVEPRFVSLQPKGVEKLADAPEEELTAKQKKYQQRLVAAAAPKQKGILGHETKEEVQEHFRKIAEVGMVSSNRWDAAPESGSDISDSEWD